MFLAESRPWVCATIRLFGEHPGVFLLFPILAKRKKQAAGKPSGGEQQMLAITRAPMSSPNLLLP